MTMHTETEEIGAQGKGIYFIRGLFYPALYENECKQDILLLSTSTLRMEVYFYMRNAI